MPKRLSDMTEREILALAITQEEEDGRIYGDFAEALQSNYPATAEIFRRMMGEESEHRRRLIEQYRQSFGDHIPLVRKQDVKGFVQRRPVWLMRPLPLDVVRKTAASMELETRRFYERAAKRSTDAGVRKLLGDLAEAEREHVTAAEAIEHQQLPQDARAKEDEARRRLFLLQVVQPGLAGLMDGSVSTLAPIFAAAAAAHHAGEARATFIAFLVGLAASIGAGISMGFAEALSDDGALTGRGHPLLRGITCGLMTTVGGLGHTLPFLIHSFSVAMTVAIIVVVIELGIISWIRHRYMDTPLLAAAFQVLVGGALVFIAGIVIGIS